MQWFPVAAIRRGIGGNRSQLSVHRSGEFLWHLRQRLRGAFAIAEREHGSMLSIPKQRVNGVSPAMPTARLICKCLSLSPGQVVEDQLRISHVGWYTAIAYWIFGNLSKLL